MLYRFLAEGPVCITQPAHAWISGQLAQQWGNEQFGSFAPWSEVCLGAEQHDIGWLTWEMHPTLNFKTGLPHSFTEMATPSHIDIWSGASQLASPLGRYVALLVSLHGTGLYERYRGWENSAEAAPMVRAYLAQEKEFQKRVVQTLQQDPYYKEWSTPEAIARNSRLIAVWDQLSLMLCMGFSEQRQVTQVPAQTKPVTLTLTHLDDQQIRVDPWPFQSNIVSLVVEGRLLQQSFADETEMQVKLKQAPCITLQFTLCKSRG